MTVMQYIVKDLMVCLSNIILGGFLGIFMKYSYTMMHGDTQAVLGIVLFMVSIGVGILYTFLLKKFVTGSEAGTTIPTVCLALGAWIGWANCVMV